MARRHGTLLLVSPGKVPRQVLLGRECLTRLSGLETDYSPILDNLKRISPGHHGIGPFQSFQPFHRYALFQSVKTGTGSEGQ